MSAKPRKGFANWIFGLSIFALILIYIVVCVVIGFQSETIKGYEVKNGVLSENRLYTGIAIRDEKVVHAKHTGYINYLLREGERVGCNKLVCCIDETGKFSDLIGKEPIEDTTLSSDELSVLRQEIVLFSRNFDPTLFSDAYIFNKKMDKEISQLENRKIIEDIDSLNSSHVNDIIDYINAEASGIVLFYEDGFEDYLASDLSEEDFERKNYKVNEICNDDLVSDGDFIYKYVNDENWSIVIKVPTDDLEKLTANDYLEVVFSKTGTSSWGKVSIVNIYEDYALVELFFTNSMVTFAKDRFVDIELKLEEDAGLKIPVSAIAREEFYLIPKEYVSYGNNSTSLCAFRREIVGDAYTGKLVELNIYKEDEDYYYVSKSSLTYGEYIYKTESSAADISTDTNERFVVGFITDYLDGVYCINKGYADFKRIDILYRDEEYAIVNPVAAYGLRVYDYIALDASIVHDKDFVY